MNEVDWHNWKPFKTYEDCCGNCKHSQPVPDTNHTTNDPLFCALKKRRVERGGLCEVFARCMP
jgi:hypothetical protein